jgi:hypothetical protein
VFITVKFFKAVQQYRATTKLNNIKLDWKNFGGKNALAYLLETVVKKKIMGDFSIELIIFYPCLDPRNNNVIKLFIFGKLELNPLKYLLGKNTLAYCNGSPAMKKKV